MQDRIIVAAAIIFRHDDRFLIARKRSGLPHEGLWEFPGGKSEPDEDPSQTVQREIMEELSMSVFFQRECYYSYPFYEAERAVMIQFHFFIGWTKNPIHLLTDHDRTTWINPDESRNYELTPGDSPAMEFLMNDYGRACLIASKLRNRGSN